MFIKGKQVVLENKVIDSGIIEIKDDKFANVEAKSQNIDIDLSSYTIIAGLVDIHVHGGNGFDCMDCKSDSIKEISHYKLKEGVTSFCPTTVTTSLETTKLAIKSVNEACNRSDLGAKIIGTFLEGPYINPEFKGAHPKDKIREICINELEDLIVGNNITSVAIAPEKENGIESIKYLVKNDINVRIGHSGATSDITKKAIESGANIAIHTYNAMRPFSHREVGIIGQVLINDDIYTELICDLTHTSSDAVEILLKMKKRDKVILVTDCMVAGGLNDGNYMLGELEVIVKDKIARTLEGSLAGSTLKLIDSVKNIFYNFNVPINEAVNMASINPATALGIETKIGSIYNGKQADLVAIDEDFNVVFAMVNGKIAFK